MNEEIYDLCEFCKEIIKLDEIHYTLNLHKEYGTIDDNKTKVFVTNARNILISCNKQQCMKKLFIKAKAISEGKEDLIESI